MKKIYIVVALLTMASLTGCKKYLDINTNPVNPQKPIAEFLLPPIIYQMANGTAQDNRQLFKVNQNMFGTVTTYASVVWERHGFPTSSDVGGVIWRMVYVDHGLNLENMIEDALANEKYEYAGIGYAIKAWGYQMATDLHGPVILDDAYTPNMLTFTYQDQPEVYARVQDWGQRALKYLDMKGPVDYSGVLAGISGDNIYQGNTERWKKFIYALYALQYSHLVNKPSFNTRYADSVIKYVDLSFNNPGDDATINFAATNADDSNPYGSQGGYLNSTSYGRIGQPILYYLTGGMRGEPSIDTNASVDPRLTRMLTPNADSIYVGGLPGVANSSVPFVLGAYDAASLLYEEKYLFADKARYPIMTYSQLQFAKAEALYHKGELGDAYDTYLRAIRAHMEFYNAYGRSGLSPAPAISESEIIAYLASDEVAQSPVELTLADIMGQKYVAQWGWAGLEQWSDLRKYHYDPEVFRNYVQLEGTELDERNNGKYAYRFRPRYNSEYVWNAEELEKWGGLEQDYMTHELWFSKEDE